MYAEQIVAFRFSLVMSVKSGRKCSHLGYSMVIFADYATTALLVCILSYNVGYSISVATHV